MHNNNDKCTDGHNVYKTVEYGNYNAYKNNANQYTPQCQHLNYQSYNYDEMGIVE